VSPTSYAADKATRKYLAHYAETEVSLGASVRDASLPFGHGLAIPVHAEGAGILPCLATIPKGSRGRVLVVAVVNAAADAGAPVHASNAHTLEAIQEVYGHPEILSPSASLYPHPAGALLVIDRASRDFLPPRKGVGLARKIGADLLLALVDNGHLESPWLHASDADVRFPADYFEQVDHPGGANPAALLYRFRHVSGSDSRAYEAALQYEISLRYYVLGLRFAGSPYAFHSIGSTLAIHANAYAAVRGFPRREAAEDFYLLNKIAKLGGVEQLRGEALRLSSRTSSRVPFGTGAGIRRLLEAPVPALTTYDPRVFHYARSWQGALGQAADAGGSPDALAQAIEDWASRDPEVEEGRLLDVLTNIGARSRAEAALATRGPTPTRALLADYDGFRTLKLIHALRAGGLADVPLQEALEKACFIAPPRPGSSASTANWALHMEALDYRGT